MYIFYNLRDNQIDGTKMKKEVESEDEVVSEFEERRAKKLD